MLKYLTKQKWEKFYTLYIPFLLFQQSLLPCKKQSFRSIVSKILPFGKELSNVYNVIPKYSVQEGLHFTCEPRNYRLLTYEII